MNQSKEAEQESLIKRKWRRYYRRARVYVPLSLVVLLAMVVLLPIRGAWLAGLVEKEAAKALGIGVGIHAAEVHLWEGRVSLEGITLEPGQGESSIRVERLNLEGTFADLIAGDGRFPRRVAVQYGTPIKVEQTAEGEVMLDSALRVLIHTISQNLAKAEPKEDSTGRGTPEVVVQNVPFEMTTPGNAEPLSIRVNRLTLDPRANELEPFDLRMEGLYSTPLPEKFTLVASFLPEPGTATVSLNLGTLEKEFVLPGRNIPLILSTNGVQWDVSVSGLNEENQLLKSSLLLERVTARHTVAGGRSWTRPELRLSVRSTLARQGNPVRGWSAFVESEGVDFGAEGEFLADAPWTGEALVQLRKAPPVIWNLLNDELVTQGYSVDTETSPSLTMRVVAKGDFTKPEELELTGEAEMRRLRVASLTTPYDLTVDVLDARFNTESLRVERLLGDFSNRVQFEVKATLDDFRTQDPVLDLEQLYLKGDPGNSLIEIRELSSHLRKILDLSLPLQLNLRARVPLLMQEGRPLVKWLDPGLQFAGLLRWDSSTLRITETTQPIRIDPGQFEFTETTAVISALQGRVEDLLVTANVNVESPSGRWITDSTWIADVRCQGELQRLISLIQEQMALPFYVQKFTGTIDAALNVRGDILNLRQPDFLLKTTLSNLAGAVPIPYSELRIANGELQLEFTRDRLSIPLLRGTLNEQTQLQRLSLELTPEALTLQKQLQTPAEFLAVVLAEDLMDIALEGNMSSQLSATFKPNSTLPEGDTVLQRWVAGIQHAPQPLLSLQPGAPFELEVQGSVTPQPEVGIWHRDMPYPVRRLRGGIRLDREGFIFENVRLDLGETKDALVNGRLNIGHYGGGVKILLDLQGDAVDFNQWFIGWGEQPWAQRPFVEPTLPGPDVRPEKLITEIVVNTKLKNAKVLSVRGTEMDAVIRYNAWRFQDNQLFVSLKDAQLYGGRAEGEAEFTFPRAYKNQLTRFSGFLRPQEVEMRDYLVDLLGGADYPRGKVSGRATLSGEIGDYDTWKGEAEFRATKSRFIGEQAFVLLTNFLNLGDREKQADSTITGTCTADNQIITFPEIKVESSEIRMLSTGTVGFNGMTDFLITVDLYRNQLSGIPLLNELNIFLNRLRNSLVSFRVNGKIGYQKVEPVPLPIQNLDFFAEGRRLITPRSRTTQPERNP